MQQLFAHRLNPQTDTNRNISKIARALPLVAYLGRKASQIGRSTLSITSLDYRRASRRLTPETQEGVMMLLFANDSSSSFLSNVSVHQIRPTQRAFTTSITFPPTVNKLPTSAVGFGWHGLFAQHRSELVIEKLLAFLLKSVEPSLQPESTK